MKRLIISVALLSSSAFANQKLSDLMYFPEQGSIVSRTYIESQSSDYSTDTDAKVEVESIAFGQTLSYAIFNDLYFSANLERKSTDLKIKSDSTAKYESVGFENPELRLTKRLLTQNDFGTNVDMTVGFSPDLFESKDSTTSDDGTVASGNNKLNAEIAFGQKLEQFQWKITSEFNYYTETKEEDASSGDKSTGDPSFDLELHGYFQTDLKFQLHLGFSAGYGYISETRSEDANGNVSKIDGIHSFTWSGYGIYELAKDANIQGVFSYFRSMDTDVDSDVSGKYEVQDYSGYRLFAAFIFQI